MLNVKKFETPCYVIDEKKLINNLEILKGVQDRTGAKILLAQKAFSCYSLYPLIGKYLSAYYILSGHGEYNDNGTIIDVQPGDVYHCAEGECHSIRAIDEPIEMIALILYTD